LTAHAVHTQHPFPAEKRTAVPTLTFDTPNAHLLQRLLGACATRKVVIRRDIYDTDGRKLAGARQHLVPGMGERLRGCALEIPLELCIEIADGVQGPPLAHQALRLIDRHPALARIGKGCDALITSTMHALDLDAVSRLLVSLAAPRSFEAAERSVAVGFVSGALAQHAGFGAREVEHAVQAGLLHDVGELYLPEALFDAQRVLGAEDWSSMARHPLIGAAVLRELCHQPLAVVRAVQEHHERLDGSGYPARLSSGFLSRLGQVTMLAEALVAILTQRRAPQSRALWMLRLGSSRFDATLSQIASSCLEPDAGAFDGTMTVELIAAHAHAIADGLRDATALAASVEVTPDLRSPEAFAAGLVRRASEQFTPTLSACIDELKRWSAGHAPDRQTLGELETLVHEARWQVAYLARDLGVILRDLAQPNPWLTAVIGLLARAGRGEGIDDAAQPSGAACMTLY
jgi:HD domain